MSKFKTLEEVTANTAFGNINSEAGRQLYLDETGKFDSTSNAQLQSLSQEVRGKVKCACDGSAEAVNSCLNNALAINHNAVPSDNGKDFLISHPCANKKLWILTLNEKPLDLLDAKVQCALKGINSAAEAEDNL